MTATSVIDTVAVDMTIINADRRQLVPIGGIAHAGARGISKVELQVDDVAGGSCPHRYGAAVIGPGTLIGSTDAAAPRVFVLLQQREIRKPRDAHVKTAREYCVIRVPDFE